MKPAILSLALLLAVAGCQKIETAHDDAPEIIVRIHNGEDANTRVHDTLAAARGPIRVRVVYDADWEAPRSTRLDTLRAASRRSAAAADRELGLSTPDRAEKVAAVMAANDITIGDVATFCDGYGYDVVSRDAWKRWHWKPSTGTVSHYVMSIRIAAADTALSFQFRNGTSSPYSVFVEAYDYQGRKSVPSDLGWSDNGDGSNALPGVGR